MRWVIAAIIALLAVLSACGHDNSTPSPSATSTRSGSATATPGSNLSGTPVPSPKPANLIQPGPDIEFPNDMAMIIESGCYGCDGGPGSLNRVYRGANGDVRTERLLDGIASALPTHTIDTPTGPREYPAFISGHAMTQDAAVMAVSFCIKGSCVFSGLGSFEADSEGVAFRSTDGGITWEEIGRGGPVFYVAGVLADGRVLIGEGKEDNQQVDLYFLPDKAPVTPPAGGVRAITTTSEVLWTTSDGRLLLSDGTEFYAPGDPGDSYSAAVVLGTFSGLEKGSALVTWHIAQPAPPTGPYIDRDIIAALDIVAGRTSEVARYQIDRLVKLAWLSPIKDDNRAVISVVPDYPEGVYGFPVPVIIDFKTRTYNAITAPFKTDRLGVSTLGRTYVRAVQTGPFARVDGTGSCLNIRDDPSPNANVITCAADGVLLRHGGITSSDAGVEWLTVTTPSGVHGWASTEFLER